MLFIYIQSNTIFTTFAYIFFNTLPNTSGRQSMYNLFILQKWTRKCLLNFCSIFIILRISAVIEIKICIFKCTTLKILTVNIYMNYKKNTGTFLIRYNQLPLSPTFVSFAYRLLLRRFVKLQKMVLYLRLPCLYQVLLYFQLNTQYLLTLAPKILYIFILKGNIYKKIIYIIFLKDFQYICKGSTHSGFKIYNKL